MENLKIGNLRLKNKFLLAPMLEPNDIAFRLLCKKEGCGLTYTGMISPLSKQKLYFEDKPAIQIFGNTSKGIKDFIKKYDKNVTLWDFNLGCPSKISKKLSHGAFMHKDLETIEKILTTMRSSTKKPITIKLRKSPNALKIASLAENYVDAISIHPRTISQGYSGKPDYAFALKLKSQAKIPVIYSGDVNEKNAKTILKDFDAVFIGRSAIGRSGIFAKLLGKKPKTNFSDYLTLAKKYNLPFRQIKYQAMNFTKEERFARKLRAGIVGAKTVEEINNIFI